jgi:hypothetical protein
MRSRFAVIGAVVAIVAAATSAAISPTIAGNIIDEWANAKAPPPPALKPVTVDIKTNALLVIDMVKQIHRRGRAAPKQSLLSKNF